MKAEDKLIVNAIAAQMKRMGFKFQPKFIEYGQGVVLFARGPASIRASSFNILADKIAKMLGKPGSEHGDVQVAMKEIAGYWVVYASALDEETGKSVGILVSPTPGTTTGQYTVTIDTSTLDRSFGV